MRVENVTAEVVTYSLLIHTAGDLGFEFAPEAVKPFACQNISFYNCAVADNQKGNLIYGTWAKGDRILFSDPQPGSNDGSVCTTGGTIGSGAVFKALNGVGA